METRMRTVENAVDQILSKLSSLDNLSIIHEKLDTVEKTLDSLSSHHNEDLNARVDQVRDAFVLKYSEEIAKDVFDHRDIKTLMAKEGEFLQIADSFVRASLNMPQCKRDVNKAVDYLFQALKWRQDFKCNDITEETLNPVLRDSDAVFYKGVCRRKYKIINFRMSQFQKGHLVHDMKCYVTFRLCQHHNWTPEEKLTFLFDCHDASLENIDLNVMRHLVELTSLWLPGFVGSLIFYEAHPAIQEDILALLTWFGDVRQKANVHFTRKNTITDYIDIPNLPAHMK